MDFNGQKAAERAGYTPTRLETGITAAQLPNKTEHTDDELGIANSSCRISLLYARL